MVSTTYWAPKRTGQIRWPRPSRLNGSFAQRANGFFRNYGGPGFQAKRAIYRRLENGAVWMLPFEKHTSFTFRTGTRMAREVPVVWVPGHDSMVTLAADIRQVSKGILSIRP